MVVNTPITIAYSISFKTTAFILVAANYLLWECLLACYSFPPFFLFPEPIVIVEF